MSRLRSPVRYYGGKGHMVAKLLSLVPHGGRPYVEPYCGGASLFFAREPAPIEVLNDLNRDLVNLFRVLQDKQTFEELRHRLMWTPYARSEFARALEILKSDDTDPVMRAWAFFVAQNQGFAGVSCSIGNWGRAISMTNGGMADTTNKWLMRLSMLDAWRWRLMRVQIDCVDALEAIRYWDTPETVFYIDPPYVPDTRSPGSHQVYTVEANFAHHQQLVDLLLRCQGAIVLSGYEHPVYAPLEDAGWEVIRFPTACYASGRIRGSALRGKGSALAVAPRVEVVWRNLRARALAPSDTQ